MQVRLRPQDTFGDYQLERRLGVGGTGEVWLAKARTRGDALVALRRLHAHLADDPTTLAVFLSQVQASRQLEHPNIARLLDSGKVGEAYFVATEYVDGLDLRSCLEAHGGPLPPRIVAALLADACRGLEHAHSARASDGRSLAVVHCNVAPDNVLLDRQGRARLVDFGIARAEDTQLSPRTGLRARRVRYMAPEYVDGQHADERTDVYAMGATLFELCTGVQPFSGIEAPVDIATAIVAHGLPPADRVRPSLPEPLVRIIAEATHRQRTRRTRNARELEMRLRQWLGADAPSAAELSAELRRWMGLFSSSPARERSEERRPVADAALADAFGAAGPAHALDDTLWQIALPAGALAELAEDKPPPTPPPKDDSLPSIILSPELEALAERYEGDKKKR